VVNLETPFAEFRSRVAKLSSNATGSLVLGMTFRSNDSI